MKTFGGTCKADEEAEKATAGRSADLRNLASGILRHRETENGLP
jgi:hypothetical protein